MEAGPDVNLQEKVREPVYCKSVMTIVIIGGTMKLHGPTSTILDYLGGNTTINYVKIRVVPEVDVVMRMHAGAGTGRAETTGGAEMMVTVGAWSLLIVNVTRKKSQNHGHGDWETQL